MPRSISSKYAPLLEQLELERPEIVTIAQMKKLCDAFDIATAPKVVAARLRKQGWLLPTSQRGVWEFAPAELAGPYSSADPLLPFKSFMASKPDIFCALTFQTAAWALGFADRVPAVLDIAFAAPPQVKTPASMKVSVFKSNLEPLQAKGVSVLAPEAILVQMVQRPTSLRSWQAVTEWLPDLAYEAKTGSMLQELEGRSNATAVKTGYLLQGLRPDIAKAIKLTCATNQKTNFGSGRQIRYDAEWGVADAILPFNPKMLEALK